MIRAGSAAFAVLPRLRQVMGPAAIALPSTAPASLAVVSDRCFHSGVVVMQEGAGAAADAGTKAAASRPVLPPPTLRFNDLRDNPGAHIRKRKKGRGVGGGHGLARSAGEGSKGQKSHEGGGIPFGFEGGQSPLWRRTPKFGYMAKIFRVEMQPVNLHKLQLWVDTGRIDPSQRITLKTLVDAGLVSNVKDGVKLLGTGAESFKARLDIEVSAASASAIAAIEKAGGSIVSTYYTPLAMKALIQPEKFEIPIKAPKPPPKRMEYYASYKSRGYLNPEVQLKQLRARLAAGMPLEQAAAIMPAFVGGGGSVPTARAPQLDTQPWAARAAPAAPAAAAAPPAPAQAAAAAQ